MTSIYVFSATGNSYTTAKELEKMIPDSKLFFIPALMSQENVVEQAQKTIFVFPVYFHDVPYPVRDLIDRMNWTHEHPEIYCFSTSRKVQKTDEVYQRLDAQLRKRGQSLKYALSIPMPGNSWANEPEEDALYLMEQNQNIRKCLDEMNQNIQKDYSASEELKKTAISTLNNYRGIMADEQCIGCGRCVQVCPMNNIHLEDGKAVIGDHCAVCLACFHWCLKEAIWMSKNIADGRRKKYHHPEVLFEDIVHMKSR